jgi:hypothetical protein
MEASFGAQVPEALLRASRIVAEAHEYLVEQANGWLDEAMVVQNSHRVQLRTNLANGHRSAWPVVQQGLTLVWHRQGWSLQAMTAEHWRMMQVSWEKSENVPSVSELPGRIVWSVEADRWSFELLTKR